MVDSVYAVGVAGLLRQAPVIDPQALQQAQERALAEAYAQGVQDGEAAMVASFATAKAQDDALFAAALGASAGVQQALGEAFAESLCGLAMAVARAVIAAEPCMQRETVCSLVDEALCGAAAGAMGTVFISDDAHDAAAAAVPSGWGVAVDAMLPAGTVRAVVDASSFTASLERRLVHVAARLAGDL